MIESIIWAFFMNTSLRRTPFRGSVLEWHRLSFWRGSANRRDRVTGSFGSGKLIVLKSDPPRVDAFKDSIRLVEFVRTRLPWKVYKSSPERLSFECQEHST